mmetsp:Transcript_27253/g.44254  ORF Transcript_27253/g.44254 Transcript_27253/m.44254 type:complete len:818 (+) Transcript_27253:27-2480(+)
MTETTGSLAAALIGFTGLISVAAFTPGSSSLAQPHVSIAVYSRVRIRAPFARSSRDYEQRSSSSTVLRGSLLETFETESISNETLGELQVITSAAAMPIAISDNDNHTDDNCSPQQPQQFLSSPVVLDSALLDGAVGVNENTNGVLVDSFVSEAASVTTLQQDDLELTLPAAINYAEQTSDGDVTEVGVESLEIPSFIARTDIISVEGLDLIEPELDSNPIEHQPAKQSISNKTPSIKKILQYTIPAIGIWLCSPVLSMIDTAAVGLLSGTAQQAALNPAVSVTDQGALLVAFMYTATTNLIAAAAQKDNDAASASEATSSNNDPLSSSQPRTTRTLTTALKLALVVGTIFGAVLGASGRTLLKILIGNDSLDPIVFSAALRYVHIRALGMPAMVVIGTAQSACLGMQDVKSPLYVLAAAAVVNFLGDVLLVPQASPMFGGAAGAAWATVASQWAALLFFAKWLTTKGDDTDRSAGFSSNKKNDGRDNEDDVVNITQGILELTGTSEKGRSRREDFLEFLSSSKLSQRNRITSKFKSLKNHQAPISAKSAASSNNIIRPKRQSPKSRGFLSDGKLTLRSYLSPSNLNKVTARKFVPFVIPVTTTSIGRISGYIAMSHVASSTLGTYDMAAHQIIFSIFCCLAPFVDALSQVAQSFVPAVFEAKDKSRERAMALRKTIGNFRAVGVGFGAVLLFLVTRIPSMSSYFTTDPIVLERVNGAIPGVGLFLLLNGLMCAGEGSLLGQKDLKFLRNMYAIFFFAVPACMLRLKYRAMAGVEAVGVGTMWATFSIYQVIRTSIWHLRLAQLQRRAEGGVLEDTC